MSEDLASCRRLNLTCLAYLWKRNQIELLDEMTTAGMESVIIKVAGAGLQITHLGQNVFSPSMRLVLRQLVSTPFPMTAHC